MGYSGCRACSREEGFVTMAQFLGVRATGFGLRVWNLGVGLSLPGNPNK